MIVSSHPSAKLFLTSGQQTPARPAPQKQEVSPAEATTNISAAGQLRAALDRLHVAAVGLGNTEAFSPKPASTENSARQDSQQDKERESRRQFNPADQAPAFNPTPPPAANNSQQRPARDDEPDIRVSLSQSVSDGTKLSLRLREESKAASRAPGTDDSGAPVISPHVPQEAAKAGGLVSRAAETSRTAPSLADVAFGKVPGAKKAEAPLAAPVPVHVPQPIKVSSAVRELTTATNELRTAVSRAEKPSETDTRTRELRDQAVRALDVIDRKAAPLKAVGIQRDTQGALQVNEPVLQAALTRAPEQVRQVLSDTRQSIAAQLPPPPTSVPKNTDNIRRAAEDAPAPRRVEAPARPTPPEPAPLVEQVSQLGQTLNSIAASGLQLQRELARQDDQSSAQSSLLNRLNTLARSMTP